MKYKELMDRAVCSICGRKIGRGNCPQFFTIKVNLYLLNIPAINRCDGLAAIFDGSARLADVMGADEDLAMKTHINVDLTLCFECAATKNLNIIQVLDTDDKGF